MISKETWNKLNNLSREELFKLADLAGIGFLNHKTELDKDELVMVLQTEPESKILKALQKLKASS